MMNAQVLIRPQGLLTSFASRLNPFQYTPSYQGLLRRGKLSFRTNAEISSSLEELRRMRDSIISEAEAMMKGSSRRANVLKKLLGPLDMTFRWTESYEPSAKDSLRATAQKLGVPELHLLFDWLCGATGTTDTTSGPPRGVLVSLVPHWPQINSCLLIP